MADHITLETPRLVLRRPEARDLAVWLAFYHSDRAVFIGGGPAAEEGRGWRAFAALIGHWTLQGCGVFVLELKESGRTIGQAGPWFPQGWPERELSWSVWDAAFEGKGLMAEAVTEIRRHVFAELGWPTAVSYIDPANARSVALAERLGCTLDPAARSPGEGLARVYRHPRP